VLGILVYYGVNLGRIYWRYWEMTDRMKTEARYSYSNTDEQMLAKLRADAREIGIPDAAKRLSIRRIRARSVIIISTSYSERIDLPLLHRTLVLKPEVQFRQQ